RWVLHYGHRVEAARQEGTTDPRRARVEWSDGRGPSAGALQGHRPPSPARGLQPVVEGRSSDRPAYSSRIGSSACPFSLSKTSRYVPSSHRSVGDLKYRSPITTPCSEGMTAGLRTVPSPGSANHRRNSPSALLGK